MINKPVNDSDSNINVINEQKNDSDSNINCSKFKNNTGKTCPNCCSKQSKCKWINNKLGCKNKNMVKKQ